MYNYFNPYIAQPVQQAPMQQTQMQQAPAQEEKIWVQGEAAALAYLVAPNSFVRLWDSGRNVFYEKRADQTGRPSIETYEYKKVTADLTQGQGISQEDSKLIMEKINVLEERLRALEEVPHE